MGAWQVKVTQAGAVLKLRAVHLVSRDIGKEVQKQGPCRGVGGVRGKEECWGRRRRAAPKGMGTTWGAGSPCKQAVGSHSCTVCGMTRGRTYAQSSTWQWELLPLGTSENSAEHEHW